MSNLAPAFLIDVDGPLNAYRLDNRQARIPNNGYTPHYLAPYGTAYRLWLNPNHGPMLLTLAEYGELMWCTTWEDKANELIAPRIGLPPLPVVEVGAPAENRGHIWKLDAVESRLFGRPFAWFDDQFERRDHYWAHARTAEGIPTLLIDVSPSTGLLQSHVDAALTWAKDHAPATKGA